MNLPGTAREALLIEALGEMTGVLDRMDALVPQLDAGYRRFVDADKELAGQLSTIEVCMKAFAEKARAHAVHHIALHADQTARRSIDLHVKAMEEAAHTLFLKEVGPALQSLVQPLQRLRQLVQQNARPWDIWLTHAATAAVASLVTWLVTSGVWRP